MVGEGLRSKVPYVFDAISEAGSLETTLRFLDPNGGIVSTMLPPVLFARDKGSFKYPKGVMAYNTVLLRIQSTHKDFGYLWSRYLGRLLEDGRLKAHPYEVIPGGLNGVLTGLQKLKAGDASALKYVYRIDETGETTIVLPDTHKANPTDSAHAGPRRNTHPLRNFPFPA